MNFFSFGTVVFLCLSSLALASNVWWGLFYSLYTACIDSKHVCLHIASSVRSSNNSYCLLCLQCAVGKPRINLTVLLSLLSSVNCAIYSLMNLLTLRCLGKLFHRSKALFSNHLSVRIGYVFVIPHDGLSLMSSLDALTLARSSHCCALLACLVLKENRKLVFFWHRDG